MKQFRKLSKVAFRNVSRNVKRTLLTALAVFIGIGVVISVRGLLNGLQGSLKDQVTKAMTGDVQIHHKDAENATGMLPLDLNLKLDKKLQDTIRSHPQVRAVSGRIVFGGMISDEARDKSTPYIGRALDMVNEFKITPLMKDNVIKGRMPQKNDAFEVVITEQLAKTMKLKIGSDVAITSRTEGGSINAYDFKVVGIFEIKLATANKRMLYMPLKTAQTLLAMPDKVTEIIVDIKDLSQSETVAPELAALLTKAGYPVKVSPWEDVAGMYGSIMGLQDLIFGIVSFVLFILVLTGVVNTMLMTVYERVREIGTMMAMGVKRGKVLMMFLMESVTIALIGSTLGVILGVAIVLVLHSVGIDFPVPGTNSIVSVYPTVEPLFVLLSVVVALVGALLAAVYPAYKASKLRPAEAIRAT